MPLTTYFYIFISALMTSVILIPPISRLAIRVGGIDKPDERKVHCDETPRLGGIAIFSAFLFSTLFFCDIDRQIKGFLSGAVIIFLTGLADDLTNLSPKQKFLGEIIAAAVAVIVGGLELSSLGNPFGLGQITLGPLAIPFTIFAVVGVTNAVNLLDGLDGLAAGGTAIACLAFGTLAYQTGNHSLLALDAALLAAIVGFLRYNTYPATIFMGDSGSLFLGYCMGIFSVMLVTTAAAEISVFVPLVVLAVPIIDTLVVMSNRLFKGKKIFSPDKSHIHHRLLDLGIGHKYCVILVYGISYFLSLFAVVCYRFPEYVLVTVLIVGATFFYIVVNLICRKKIAERIELKSNQPIRETRTYRRMVEFSQRLLVLLKYLLLTILILALFTPSGNNPKVIFTASLLLLLFAILLLLMKDKEDMFLHFALYLNGAFVIFIMENLGRETTLLGIPLLTISNHLFFSLLAVEGAKIFLRKRTDYLISNPFEYLILLIVIAVPLLPTDFTSRYHLLTVAAKSVIMFVAYRLVLLRQVSKNKKIVFATFIALIIFIAKYLMSNDFQL
ncbi:UDP-N-acetylglucosamine--undecaprenyl-phosphate N-acetylglucosaminephosphotransferase, putative [Geotalea daltonii FRC-32]|uniref:UDP-N-acetylglucosamine--undecaprenyl-phosphate N-acetylglucosaminephosphotransferase, putative n=1 Tax=Geotalea daltonii (strain DSM 22248 / JCM 15807 / FRC-32) TaxID=316067 RepID=B9M8Z7_GEODF|nr:MraY family glycosyltransferase [Geotalea daltonii]ACM20493.1 UDP-N-acetylglucosamine--undecaprenyl-phosphate N-acetylglucosaminephosphotransferase, putative [Geotalea daltonii FRC-32]